MIKDIKIFEISKFSNRTYSTGIFEKKAQTFYPNNSHI